MPIHPDTSLGPVSLVTADLRRLQGFYQEVIGLEVLNQDSHQASLGVGTETIVLLKEEAGAIRPPHHHTGLYHLAILTPSRLGLARSLRHLAEQKWPVQGFADHGASEAVYLADPDGNGIEIYRDRSRDEWPIQNSHLRMGTEPLNLQEVLEELKGDTQPDPTGMLPGTRIGHVHLRVSDVAEAEAFYCNVLGFDLVQRYGPSAGFVSAGGYHHHIGMNSWESAGADAPPPGSTGLRYFTIYLPDGKALEEVTDRLRRSRLEQKETPKGILVRDPSQNGILLSKAAG